MLIDDILEISKIESNQIEIKKTKFNLKKSVDSVVEIANDNVFQTQKNIKIIDKL
jgi:signal transduction histidine kinase